MSYVWLDLVCLQEKEERTGEGVCWGFSSGWCAERQRLVFSHLAYDTITGKNESEEKRELIFKEDGQGVVI